MSNPNRKPIFRIALFWFCAILIFLALSTLYSFTNTLRQLDAIELARDQWQRPVDVLRALDLQEGNTVVDLGSGSGYFALKLSPGVGKQGRVLAVDLRKLSLFFLWTRALLVGDHNVHVAVGTEDDPQLPKSSADAVLICNTYHEFGNPGLMLARVAESLRPGGRLVVADRAPGANALEHAHEVALSVVEDKLRQAGFEIVRHDDHFIERANDREGDDTWWLVIARKP